MDATASNKPAAGGGLHGVDAAFDHRADGGQLLGGHALPQRQIERIEPRAECVEQVAQPQAPRLAHGSVASGQRDVAKMRAPLEAGKIRHQEFPAPDLAVGAEAGSIERHADHLIGDSVLGHAACDVGVMVLHADLFDARHVERQLGAEVHGVKIVGHRHGRDPEQFFHALQRFLEEHQRFVVLQVADVLAQEGVVFLRQAERVLQLGAAGEDFGDRESSR